MCGDSVLEGESVYTGDLRNPKKERVCTHCADTAEIQCPNCSKSVLRAELATLDEEDFTEQPVCRGCRKAVIKRRELQLLRAEQLKREREIKEEAARRAKQEQEDRARMAEIQREQALRKAQKEVEQQARRAETLRKQAVYDKQGQKYMAQVEASRREFEENKAEMHRKDEEYWLKHPPKRKRKRGNISPPLKPSKKMQSVPASDDSES